MVFKGYVPMTSKSLNLADDVQKLLLNAVEGGTGISYTVMNKWDNSLIDSNLFNSNLESSFLTTLVNDINITTHYYNLNYKKSIDFSILLHT